jgi:hypothetical protein
MNARNDEGVSMLMSPGKRPSLGPGKPLRRGAIAALLTVVFVALYLVPNLIDLTLLRQTGPWVSCVVFGDIVGCAILFIIGLRVTAVVVYAFATAVEALLLWPIGVSGASLVWLTGLLPAVVVAVFLCLRLTLSSAGGISKRGTEVE